jgi:glycosyltransferase involved in cell wall biosynthesis
MLQAPFDKTRIPGQAGSRLRIFVVHASHHLTDHLPHGDGLVAWGFVNELAKRGHRIHAVTDHLDVRADTPPNLTLVEFPRVKMSTLTHYAAYARKVRRYFQMVASSEGVDVVHQMNPVVRGLSLALLGKQTPIVLGTYVGDWAKMKSSPDYVVPTYRRRVVDLMKSGLDRMQQNFATSLVLATPNALERVPARERVSARIEYLHHGVDTQLFNPLKRTGDPERREQSILYVGSYHGQKGVLDLIDAFGRIAADLPFSRIVFAGGRGRQDMMEARLEMLGLAHRAEIVGRLEREEVAGWMRACTLLCAPSYGEPYGQNVLEAMATGKPVVIGTEGGHSYLSGALGKISVPPGDVGGLARALAAILSDPARATSMGRVNRSLAEQWHSWPRAVDKLEEIYERAIRRHRS